MSTHVAPAIDQVVISREGVYMLIAYDHEWGMLASLAEALGQHARCIYCGAPPQIDFGACPCDRDTSAKRHKNSPAFFECRIDCSVWEDIVEPLWRRDLRRVKSRNRRDAIRDSDEPSYSASDVAWLRRVQNNACYYCGTSIHTSSHVEHLEPLARRGSNGFRNIMLACPSCNAAKGTLSEASFWRRLRKQMGPLRFERVRNAAKVMKREKWPRRTAGS